MKVIRYRIKIVTSKYKDGDTIILYYAQKKVFLGWAGLWDNGESR